MQNSAPEKPLSVLIISPHPSVRGGVVTWVETLKRHLKDCDVTSFYVGSRQDKRENPFCTFWRVITAPFSVVTLVKKQRIELVHINPSLDCKSAVRDGLILLALRLSDFRKTLVYFHGWQKPVEQFIRRMPGLRQFVRWLLNSVHVMVLSEEFKQGLQAMGVEGKRITVTHTMFDGAVLGLSSPSPLTGALSSPSPLTGEGRGEGEATDSERAVCTTPLPNPPPQGGREFKQTILFMSRFVREKGMYELLEAFARIAPDYPDTDLILAGDGKEMPHLRQRVAELGLHSRVQFPGYVNGAEKAALLCSCTLFAMPTYYPEGMPVALLEAMGAGKPLLTSDAGGIGHVITDPENGVVLKTITAETIEAGLRRLLSDANYVERTGRHNHVYAWKHFEAARVTAEIEAIYYHVAAY